MLRSLRNFSSLQLCFPFPQLAPYYLCLCKVLVLEKTDLIQTLILWGVFSPLTNRHTSFLFLLVGTRQKYMQVLGFVLSSLLSVLNRQALEVSGCPVTHRAHNLLSSSLQAVSRRQKQHFSLPVPSNQRLRQTRWLRDRLLSKLKLQFSLHSFYHAENASLLIHTLHIHTFKNRELVCAYRWNIHTETQLL